LDTALAGPDLAGKRFRTLGQALPPAFTGAAAPEPLQGIQHTPANAARKSLLSNDLLQLVLELLHDVSVDVGQALSMLL
ncbi:hypothetical protein AAIH27_33450, partial [Pseudomonas aeruginosa]|uniref:hypothetical protein n=1 Tax=Pseudomonas aeruginosa TaxID=287 RepID=UPI0031B7C8B1